MLFRPRLVKLPFIILFSSLQRRGARPWRRVSRPLASTSLSLGEPTCESLCFLLSPTPDR